MALPAPSRATTSADDRRFVMVRGVTAAEESELILTENWFQELKARMRK